MLIYCNQIDLGGAILGGLRGNVLKYRNMPGVFGLEVGVSDNMKNFAFVCCDSGNGNNVNKIYYVYVPILCTIKF